jgi:hypothetical protein
MVQKVGGDSGTNVIKGAAETCCMVWLVSALLSQPTTGLTGELLASIRGEVGAVFEIQVASMRSAADAVKAVYTALHISNRHREGESKDNTVAL